VGVRVAAAVAIAFFVLVILAPLPTARAHDPATGPSPASDPGPQATAFVPFAPNVRVNTVNFGFNYQVEPTMAVSPQGRIFVGWKEALTHNGGGQRVGFATSNDRGATFSPNILMPLERLSRQSDPWLTVTQSGRAYFTRIEYDSTASAGGISVTNTTDGATWTPKVLVADSGGGLGGIVQVHPNGTVLATWWSYLSDDIRFDRSFDGGATWGADLRVNGVPGAARAWGAWQIPIPSMAVDPASGAIYIAWPDSRAGNQDIYLARSTDGGGTWSETRVDDDTGVATQYMVDLAVDPLGGVHAAWEDARSGNWSIHYSNSTDGGLTWNDDLPVSTVDTPSIYDRPGDYFAIESGPDGTIYVVWTDGRGADHDIYFAKLERTFPTTIETVPAGLNVAVDGVQFTAPATFSWRPGSSHAVSAPSPQAFGALSRRVFASWSDGGGVSHAVIAGDAAASFTATFDTEHEVAVRTSPIPLDLLVDGSPVVGAATSWWREGSPHTIDAPTPQVVSSGRRYVFASWSDGGVASHSIAPTAPATFEATFRLQFLLTVASAHGSPTGAGWYDESAAAAFGVEATVPGGTGTRYVFTGWSGDSTYPRPDSSLSMDGPKTVTATWRTEHLLTIITPHGTAEGGGWYTEGGVATASVPDTVTVNGTGYRFTGWSGDSTDASSAVFVTMDGPKTLTATWTVVPQGPPSSAALDVLPWIVLAILVAVVGFLIFFVLQRRRRKEDEESRPPPPSGS
jgi:uncharacterized repeat protein (TIGR02543 family)